MRSHHTTFHTGMEEKMIDMTSLASLENRTEEMPRLVNMDPQVLLEDIQDLTDQDLNKLMPLKSGVLQFDFTVTPTSHPYGEKNAQHVDDLMVDTDLSVEGSSTEQAEGLERCSKRRKLSPEHDYHKAVADSVSVQFEKLGSKGISGGFLQSSAHLSVVSDSKLNTEVSESLESEDIDIGASEHQQETECLSASQGFLIGDISKTKRVDASDASVEQSIQSNLYLSEDHDSDNMDTLSPTGISDGKTQHEALIGDDKLLQEGNVLDDMDELMGDTSMMVGDEVIKITCNTGVPGDEVDALADELIPDTGVMGDEDEFTEQRGVMGGEAEFTDAVDEVDGQVKSGSSQSKSGRSCSSNCEDPGNVFNTLNSWLSSA